MGRNYSGKVYGCWPADVYWGVTPQKAWIDAKLSPRERQIVELVADGLSNAEISERLSLRLQTVKNRLSEIYEKVGVRSRTDLALWVVGRRTGTASDA